jgi:hypothetical protein
MIRIKRVCDSSGARDGRPPDLQHSVWAGEVGTLGFLKMFGDDDIRTEDFIG